MSIRNVPCHPAAKQALKELGERLRVARRLRRITQVAMARRVGVSVPTLAKLEDGHATSSMATLGRVLVVLDLTADLDKLAADDKPGQELLDTQLTSPLPHWCRLGKITPLVRRKPGTG
ncbi:helix-turn-helix domain-containing protein [Dyella sp. 2RAB6]|uniref:helix-turn-helix domain-containing protein n=1 Tax=Dyella sp. 2RAB6 TaxID=3232992 RepID=UPI003F8FD504